VLTIHLKRFDFFGRGHKLSKKVEFGMDLDLAPYMTSSKHGGPLYDLYAVLVHHGHSLHSGHYVCYVKAANGMWHLCDDHRVAPSSQRVVEGQQAYILFYLRREPKASKAAAAALERAAAERVMQVRAAMQASRGAGSRAAVPPTAAAAAAGLGRADSGVHSLVASASGANEGAVAAAAGRAGRVVAAAAAIPAAGVRPSTAAARSAQEQQHRKEDAVEAGPSGRKGSAASGTLHKGCT
jgi:ubiquitin carboxyl-terminal hydrolase 36/42